MTMPAAFAVIDHTQLEDDTFRLASKC